MTGLATSVTRMAWAMSPRDFARGRCEAEDVERAVARRMFLQCQAFRFSRLAVAPGGGAKANSTRIRAPPTISDSEACGRTREASSTEWSDARAPQGVGGSPHTHFSFCVQRCSDRDYNDNFDLDVDL